MNFHLVFLISFLTTQFNLIRETYAPDIDSDQFPPAQHVRSIHNMPIEGLWHWFVTLFGVDIKDAILDGKVTGTYNPGNPIHPYVIWLIRNLDDVLNHLSVPLAVFNDLNALSQGISRHFKTVFNLLE